MAVAWEELATAWTALEGILAVTVFHVAELDDSVLDSEVVRLDTVVILA